MYELTIERTFNATHALRLYDGTVEPTHGHDWLVKLTISADRLDAIDVVIDFHVLERQLADVLVPMQHAHLNDLPAFASVNPSAERVAQHVADAMAAALPPHVALVSAAVTEAPGCVAVYRPDRPSG